MKKTKRPRQADASAAVTVKTPPRAFLWWPWAAGLLALFLVFELYGPALAGPFVLDDRYLPFFNPKYQGVPLMGWILGLRPMLMFSFWLNYAYSGTEPYIYHFTNVLLHFANSVLVALIAVRLLQKGGLADGVARPSLGVFAGALFLVHPAQTESVAYVASRSEVLSVLFYYAAFCVFLYRRTETITLARAAAVLALFGAAAATKEHTLTLPLLLLLTDVFWEEKGWRANRWLHFSLIALSVAGVAVVWFLLRSADSAGFNLPDISPASYFYTQCRVVLSYVGLFFLPVGQNADPEVAISHTLLEHGAIVGLLAWLAVAVAAWVYRKRWPLASFGIFVFLLLVAPTSSFIPILDASAERRLYLPFIGLTLVCLELLRRLELKQRLMIEVPVLLLLMWGTYSRSDIWGSPMKLWQDTVAKSPHKVRPRFQLAYAYYERNQCGPAVENYEIASHLAPPDYPLLVDWAEALDCAGRPNEAIEKLEGATHLEFNAQAWALMGMIHAKQHRTREALQALENGQSVDPRFAMIYFYRGNIYREEGQLQAAADQYRHVLDLDPAGDAGAAARQALAAMEHNAPPVQRTPPGPAPGVR